MALTILRPCRFPASSFLNSSRSSQVKRCQISQVVCDSPYMQANKTVLTRFRRCLSTLTSPSSRAKFADTMPQQLSGVDAEQEQFMEQEMIALLDKNDCVIGGASKRECHERTKEFPNGRLHRAFSVFLFNSKNELLLQKRASSKITFPNLWTNTCCSHPLYNGEELADENHIGIKRAAVRKLEHELGISPKEIRPTDFHFLTRIEYQAFQTDEKWTEHEIDYILVGKMDTPVSPNPNEVSDVRFVDQKELKSLIENDKSGITPWFSLIAKQHLFGWWDQLGNIIAQGGLESEQEANTIHRMGVYDPK